MASETICVILVLGYIIYKLLKSTFSTDDDD